MKKFDLLTKKKCVIICVLNVLVSLLIGMFFAPWYIWIYFVCSTFLLFGISKKKTVEQKQLEKMIKESKNET